MATLNSVSPQPFSPLGAGLSSGKPASAPLLNPRPNTPPAFRFPHSPIRSSNKLEPGRRRRAVAAAFTEDLELVPVPTSDGTDPLCGVVRMPSETAQEGEATGLAGGECQGFSSSPSTPGNAGGGGNGKPEDVEKLVDRSINAAIVLAAGSFAITKLLTIDHDYWHGWTFFEILRYAPQHNWSAYEGALKANPVLAKMMISGIVYSLGDWIAQCCQGKPLFEFDRARMFRSGLVGFCLHGSLSHYYYHFCEALFPFQDWWVVPAKVAFDQTLWAATWNSIYYAVVGILRFESPATLFGELKATFWPMLTAGWKLWPFAHLITYGVIPLEQRLLWVDTIELIWVTILSTYSNEKSEARISEAAVMDPQTQSSSSSLNE